MTTLKTVGKQARKNASFRKNVEKLRGKITRRIELATDCLADANRESVSDRESDVSGRWLSKVPERKVLQLYRLQLLAFQREFDAESRQWNEDAPTPQYQVALRNLQDRWWNDLNWHFAD